MKTTLESYNPSYQGRLITTGNFSKKPTQCLNQVSEQIEELVQYKNWNLLIRQNYTTNSIDIACDGTKPHMSIPVTSAKSKYISAVKTAISNYEKAAEQNRLEQYEEEARIEAIEEIGNTIKFFALIPFIMVAGMITDCIKDIRKFFK